MAGVKGRSGGHNVKTSKAHKLQGTFRKHRHAGSKSPEPPAAAPQPPKKLEGDTADEWTRMLERLRQSNVLSSVDGAALYQYCRLFAETEALMIRQEEIASAIDIL